MVVCVQAYNCYQNIMECLLCITCQIVISCRFTYDLEDLIRTIRTSWSGGLNEIGWEILVI